MANLSQPDIQIDQDLLLRPWRREDFSAVIDAHSSQDIQHYHFRRIDTEDEAHQWIDGCAEGWQTEKSATWAIIQRRDNSVAGRVTVYTTLEDGYGEVSYWVLPNARGQGIATRACAAATRWAHDLGIHRIQLEHSTRNDASRQVALKAGFVKEGIRRGANLHDDGWHDMVLYSHLATDNT